LAVLTKVDRPHVLLLTADVDQSSAAKWADRAETAAKRDIELWKGPAGTPTRFMVFAAPDDDTFARAYGGGRMPKGTVAFCAPTIKDGSTNHTVVGSRITWDTDAKGTQTEEGQTGVMKHEMGHAMVGVFGGPGADRAPLWVVEGFAEYQEWVDRFGEYYMPSARDFVHSDKFTGKLPTDAEIYGEDAESNGINYHLSMTAIRFLVDKYGADKAYNFVVAVYRDPRELDSALQTATGLDRGAFESKWAQWVKSHV
jgi:hypothetical protein